MKRKDRQKAKKLAWQIADELSAESKRIAESAKLVDSANWVMSVKNAGGVDKLSAKHRSERLTRLPKALPKVGKVGMVKDSLPFESTKNGILTIKRCSKSAGYAAGLDTMGFVFCLGYWRKLQG